MVAKLGPLRSQIGCADAAQKERTGVAHSESVLACINHNEFNRMRAV